MNPIRILTWPARTALGFASEAIWLARALAEVYGGFRDMDEEPYIWALSNEEIDAIVKGDE